MSKVEDDEMVRIEYSKPLLGVRISHWSSPSVPCHRIISTYLCKLPQTYCHTQLPTRPHHEAIVRQLYSVSLYPWTDVFGVCTCRPCLKRSSAEVLSLVSTIKSLVVMATLCFPFLRQKKCRSRSHKYVPMYDRHLMTAHGILPHVLWLNQAGYKLSQTGMPVYISA